MGLSRSEFDACLSGSLQQALGDHGLHIDYSVDLADAGFDSFMLSNFVLAFEESVGSEIPQECLEAMAEAPTLAAIRDILHREFVDNG